MKNALKNEKTLMRSLRVMAVLVIVLNVVFGIVGAVAGKDMFFVCESIWVIAGFALLFLHAYPTLGGAMSVGMVVIGCVVSLFFECTGINFGWFFSKYIYTSYIPGPKIWGFNAYSLIAYGIGCYIIWGTVRSMVGQYSAKLTKRDVIVMPILASLILVTVDFATDPFLSTINHTHIWEKPGVYYGIPWQNYVGWYLMAYVIYLVIALVQYAAGQKGKLPETPSIARKKEFWIYPPLMYASLWIQMPFYTLISNVQEVVVESNGQSFTNQQIYWGVMIVMLGAMVTPAIMAIYRVITDDRLEK